LFKNSVVLLSGGSGTIGQAMTSYLLKEKAKKIIIYSRGEMLQYEMHNKFKSEKIRYFIGDVRDKERLYRAMVGVDYVVHAAALKQVPACEYNPIEAIKTNILGAMNVIDAAIDNGVKKVIALSTDKAVNPINLYGATKLCSDKLFIQANAYSGNKGTIFAVVRYGNVANSRGSVIPFFESKYKEFMKTHFKESSKELQLPVTHEDMTRFHITIEQGVGLIAKAFKESKGGEIFVAKIPSFKIIDLVNSMGCSYKITGIRPGEKLAEVMITADDAPRVYEQKDCYIIYPEGYAYKCKGKKVESNFSYSSDKNTNWIYK